MQLVRRAHPARRLTRANQTLEIVIFALIARQISAAIVDCPVCNREHGVEHSHPELVANTLLQHGARVVLADTVLDHVVKNPGDDDIFVAAIAREDDRDVRRMCQIRQPRPLPHLAIVMLGSEGEGVVDSIRVAVDRHHQSKLAPLSRAATHECFHLGGPWRPGSRADLLHGKRCRLDVIPQHDPQWIAAGKTNRLKRSKSRRALAARLEGRSM